MTSIAERLLTEDEFLALPDDPEGRKLELFDGKVVRMAHSGQEHGVIAQNINFALGTFMRSHSLGRTLMDTGFKLRSNPDRVVVPDVGVVSASVLAGNPDPKKSVPAAPALAVEVVSPTDRDRDIADKALEYLEAGSQRVWIVHPTTQTVTVHRSDQTSRMFRAGETLTSDDAGFEVEGFALAVGDVFAQD